MPGFVVPDSDRIADQPGQPGLNVVPLPPKPSEPKTTYRTLKPEEVTARGLPPGSYQVSSEGKVDKLGDAPKTEQDESLKTAIKGLGLDEWLKSVADARAQVESGWATGVRGTLGGSAPWGGTTRKDFLATLGGIQGASILEKLQTLREQSKTGASGMGALSEKEGERLASAIAALSPDMSGDLLLENLAVIERHAKTLQAVGAGEDPNDPEVQKRYGIGPIGSTENPIINGQGDQGPTLVPSSGETRSIIDPNERALGEKIAKLMSAGANRATIMAFAAKNKPALGSDERFLGWVDEALAYREKHPKAQFSVDPEFYTREVPLSASEKIDNQDAQSGAGAFAMHAADAISAGNLGKAVGNEEEVARALAVADQQHGGASLAGDIAGGGAAALTGEAALARLGMAPGLARSLIADMGYGGTAAGTNTKDGNYLGNVAKGAAIAAGGSLVGDKLAKGAGSTIRGVSSPTAGYVAREIPGSLTIGQAVGQSGPIGKVVKGVEDRISGIPVVGDAVNARRLEGFQKMNSKAFDRALEPIGGKVSGKFGEEAVVEAQDAVGQAFTKALAGKQAGLDRGFIVDATKAKLGVDALPDSVRVEVNNQIDHVINNYFDDGGQISGENMQALLQELGGIKRGYAGTPLGHRIGKVVDQFSDSVENLFRRQAPDVMPQYDAAKRAFRRVSTLEEAVLKAHNTGGVFTPAQLGMADRANSVKFDGKHAAAAGKGQFHEFQRNMQDVLPSKVPDSGTAGRLIVPLAVVGAGAGGGAAAGDAGTGAGTGLTLAALLTMAYSRAGQRALTGAVLKRGNAARAAGKGVRKAAPAIGHGTGAAAALANSRD